MGPGGHLGSKVAPGADLTPKTRFAGPPGAPKLGAKIDQKSIKKSIPNLANFLITLLIDFGALLEPI